MCPRISIWGCVVRFVRRSVGPSVRWSVTCFFFSAKNDQFSSWTSLGQSNMNIAECTWCAGCAKCAKCASCASYMCFIHVLHVLYMPMDASLACWASFSSLNVGFGWLMPQTVKTSQKRWKRFAFLFDEESLRYTRKATSSVRWR